MITAKNTVQCMDEHLVKTMAMVAGGLLAGVAITKASSALSDVSLNLNFCSSLLYSDDTNLIEFVLYSVSSFKRC